MSATKIRRRQRRDRYGLTEVGRTVLTRRVVAHLGRGVHVPYAGGVAAEIDRAAWAALITQLVAQESAGNKTAFAAAIGVDRKTVSRWLQSEVAVSEDNVRTVARKLGLPARDMLVRVGYYQADELPPETPAERAVVNEDAAIRAVREADLPLSMKRQLIEHLEQTREEFERQRLAEAQRMINMFTPRRRGGARNVG